MFIICKTDTQPAEFGRAIETFELSAKYCFRERKYNLRHTIDRKSLPFFNHEFYEGKISG